MNAFFNGLLGAKATNLRMVQRDLQRLVELGMIEKMGVRKDAYYRALRNLEEEEPSSLRLPEGINRETRRA